MPTKSIMRNAVLACLLVATAAMAQTQYDEGQKALREQEWLEAAGHFKEALGESDSPADAATYWMAYAYYKANHKREAERALRRLEQNFPDSPWLKEAQALRFEHQDPDASAETIASLELDEEMRLFALMQLMERNPGRTMPLVLDMIRNAESEKTRRNALFMLAMSDDEAARAPLLDIARNADDPEMQREAIHMLGMMEATEELQALYPEQNRDTKVIIIESLGVAGDTEALRQVLASESDPELRKAAIFGIAMHSDDNASEFAEEIYRSAQSVDEKITVLESMVMMDEATDMALNILETETDPRLQVHAIHMLGVMDASDELAGLYGSMPDRNVRMAILEALSIADDSAGLVQILESEEDPRLRAMAVESLAVNGSPEASRYLVQMYPGASDDEKAGIIRSMLILDDSDALLALMKQENDPKLKREMMHTLVMMDSDEVDDELFELLEKEE